jgi:hypothetical protein
MAFGELLGKAMRTTPHRSRFNIQLTAKMIFAEEDL